MILRRIPSDLLKKNKNTRNSHDWNKSPIEDDVMINLANL
jgi:hypothetical protein